MGSSGGSNLREGLLTTFLGALRRFHWPAEVVWRQRMVYWFAAERPKARGAELKLPEKVRQSRFQSLAAHGRWRRYNPFSSSDSVVPRAEAILLRVRSPGSRVPRSKSEICTSWTPDCSARSICRQFRARRSFLIRS